MDGQNQLFMNNVDMYLRNHSIIVPANFTDGSGDRGLTSGHIYTFDLQRMTPGENVRIQPEAAGNLVILTLMANRGRIRGCWTRGIVAMWLAGPNEAAYHSENLPGGPNYVFTQGLGGCSVYIRGGRITHDNRGSVPAEVAAEQQIRPKYTGASDNFNQTCAVAYRVVGARGGAEWKLGSSVPHDVGPHHIQHPASQYQFTGYRNRSGWPTENA